MNHNEPRRDAGQPRHEPSSTLSGRRVLVVEDTQIVAMEIKRMLEQAECEVIGPVGWLEQALEAARGPEFDAALLDVNLHGETSDEVAEVLLARHVPFVFMTGYGREGMSPWLRDFPRLTKPFGLSELRDALIKALREPQHSDRTESSSRPQPASPSSSR
jgi:DNA-binding response OmpR family regulator